MLTNGTASDWCLYIKQVSFLNNWKQVKHNTLMHTVIDRLMSTYEKIWKKPNKIKHTWLINYLN